MKSKVLLIRANPTDMENTRLPESLAKALGFVPPLGLASVAGFLREHGVEVDVLDAQAEQMDLAQIRRRMEEYEPTIVGLTCMTPTVHDDFDVAGAAKELGATTVIGGPHADAMPEETIERPEVDFVVIGEGEEPMFRLVEAIEGDLKFEDVPGLVFHNQEGKVHMNEGHLHPELDELPYPAYDLLPFKRYGSIITKDRLSTICPGRGCPFKCGFCFKLTSDKSIRFRSPESVAEELEYVVNEFGVNEINFVSDTLTLKKTFIFPFCEEIIRRNIKISWVAPTRADCVSPEMLKLMKKAGCRSLRFGVETGSDKIIKLLDKSLTKERAKKAFKWAKEAEIESFAYFILGYIGETDKTVQETLDFVRELSPDLLMYNAATPLPSTRLFEQSIEAGLVEPDYWKKFVRDRNTPRISYLHPKTEEWIKKAYRQFFFRPSFVFNQILQTRPSNISSNIRAFRGLTGL